MSTSLGTSVLPGYTLARSLYALHRLILVSLARLYEFKTQLDAISLQVVDHHPLMCGVKCFLVIYKGNDCFFVFFNSAMIYKCGRHEASSVELDSSQFMLL